MEYLLTEAKLVRHPSNIMFQKEIFKVIIHGFYVAGDS